MTMLRDEVSCPQTRTAIVPSPLDAALWLRARLHTRTKRNAVKELLKAEQHRLDDLGITRGDLHEALESTGDVALALKRISAKRRCAERAAARR